ncbi:hypothetical protein LTSEALA_4567 [Salmonella enterica subsp. enterica serovar Alachua str. R6-377]|uniref:Uncharacterized protein n=1 Tax=Salmonella enterica subsp. enterica serovar Alachua str. R6-377 TaxID=913241 RepID=G5LTT9_SALET|nr:hypothetical protein LTSEALA_4567 [Salmonella enterica subsp. enterica serovar Alachua str. R6-377]
MKLNNMAPKEYKKADDISSKEYKKADDISYDISSAFFNHDPFDQLALRSCAWR